VNQLPHIASSFVLLAVSGMGMLLFKFLKKKEFKIFKLKKKDKNKAA